MSVIRRRSDVDEVGEDFGEENDTCFGMIVRRVRRGQLENGFKNIFRKTLTS